MDQENLFRELADGLPVDLNQALTESDKQNRVETYWRPYHQAIETLMDHQPIDFLLSVHSFTPLYEGQPRAVEMGVLHDGSCTELAAYWRDRLEALSGMDVRLNEPYTGIGAMYAASRHAERGTWPSSRWNSDRIFWRIRSSAAAWFPSLRRLCAKLGNWNRAGRTS